MEDNMTEYNAIISILTLGIILWFIGIDGNKDGIQLNTNEEKKKGCC